MLAGYNQMERRHFLMSAAVVAAARPAMASPSDRVRIACVGVRGQGGSHIENYLKMPDVEIAGCAMSTKPC